jgi:lysozyme family protein
MLVVPASVVAASYAASLNNIAADGVLTHEEYMQLSSREAKLLRICQYDEIFTQMARRYGSVQKGWKPAIEEYAKLKAAKQREGQPTMPKFVDPSDPPSFQETMWQKGYICQEDDWLSYVRD